MPLLQVNQSFLVSAW